MDNTKISSVVAKKLLEVKRSFRPTQQKIEARKKRQAVETDPTVPSTKRRDPTGIDDSGSKRTYGGEAPTGEDYSVGI